MKRKTDKEGNYWGNIFYVYILLNDLKPGNYKYYIPELKKDLEFDYEPYYVGKGKEKRVYDHFTKSKVSKRSGDRAQIIKDILDSGIKHPKYIKIIKDVEEEYAFSIETAIVKVIGRFDLEKGPLTNKTGGGKGPSGNIGSLHGSAKELFQYDLSGNYLSSFIGMSQMTRQFESKSYGCISTAVTEGTTAFGFQWSYEQKQMPNVTQKYKMIFITGNVPSSKNSKVWTGKFLVNSKQTVKYIKESEKYWIQNKDNFLDLIKNLPKPYFIGLHFIRDSKRHYDWINPVQTVQDLMVKYGWLEDDDIDNILPIPTRVMHKFSTVYPFSPGVFIRVYTKTPILELQKGTKNNRYFE